MKTKARKTRKRVARVTESSGNVFADLGLPNPVQELLKVQLTLQIHTIFKDRGMTQVEIAKILGVRQPQVSLLMRNRAGNFSGFGFVEAGPGPSDRALLGRTPHGVPHGPAPRR
jgi:predicted XRE-type DNA-binding protein